MRWRVHENGIFCGTLRIARFDFDTNPSEEYKQELFALMESRLNQAPQPSQQELFEAARVAAANFTGLTPRYFAEATAIMLNQLTIKDLQETTDGGEADSLAETAKGQQEGSRGAGGEATGA